MKRHLLAIVALLSLALAGCTTTEGALVGGAIGGTAGAIATNTAGGTLLGAGIGALAGAVLVASTNGTCTYRYKGKLYKEPCR